MMKMIIKKLFISLSILLALGFVGYKYLNWSFNQPCDPPERPDGIPVSAKWYGGCDGGAWLEFVECRNNKYRFRIYLDYVATVMLDADYVVTEGCSNVDFPRDRTILNKISRIDSYFKQLYFKDIQECHLRPIYPAIGGDYWDVLKEKPSEWQGFREN
ncbi:MAG: hypothetical protein RIC80_14215 [Cyclobacteriaceae bacterium]